VQAERLEKFCLIIKNNYWGLFNQKVTILMPEWVCVHLQSLTSILQKF
jgi:hypothetical protein